jgi:diguanylate cyclase (GGDEF)-like protein
MSETSNAGLDHPRVMGWVGATALGMGGSNQSLFLLAALMVSQGSGAIPLLLVGLVLSWAALPGWTELVLMWPNRVGGISASCAEAFRPYSPVLANLTGTCYWWGWVPTCGLTAILSASALHQWYLPFLPVSVMAAALVAVFAVLNLSGMRRVTRAATWIAAGSAALAFASALIPVATGHVDWQQASTFHLVSPFTGLFGGITSAMAGLYLIGFAAPAFEAAACHVGEMRDPERNLPRAMFASAGMATLYFLVLPVVWLGVLGPATLTGDLAATLGPTFAPLLFGAAKAAAVWFMVLNMFHGTLTPLSGASRTLSQLSEDGLLPRSLARRNRADAPWVAIVVTAVMAILFLLGGDPVWVIAAANFTYLIGIALPSIAVLLLRKNEPERHRPYRAPRWTIGLGVGAALIWLLSTVLGFEQFGLPTVLLGLALAYSGSVAYTWRRWRDGHGLQRRVRRSLHLKLTGAMLAVLVLDGIGYLIAVSSVRAGDPIQVAILKDIFVAVALVTITVGLVLPGMIAHAATQVAEAADQLATGTLADLTRAMGALAVGDLAAAHARVDYLHVEVHSADEVGAMATSFNTIVDETARAAISLGGARQALQSQRDHLERAATRQAAVAELGRRALDRAGLPDLLEEAIQLIATVLQVPMTSILELSSDATVVRLTHGTGWPRDALGHTTMECDPLSPLSAALQQVRPVVVDDLSDPPSSLAIPPVWLERGAQSGVWVPITTLRRQPFGVLAVHAGDVGRFGQDDVHFLEAMANVVGSAIERSRGEELLAYQAVHDPLTNLPNRVLFVDRLTNALERLERHPTTLAVLFLDIDRFKLVNDSVGHVQGNDVLIEVATRLRKALRAGDTLARFGGDEFVVLCEDVIDEVGAVGLADRLIEFTQRPIVVNGKEHVVTLSAGVALASSHKTLVEELLRDADAAMYQAKEDGRARVTVFAQALRAKARYRVDTEVELRRALGECELRVHYQPVVNVVTGAITGFEALVRWQHPERGLVYPVEFISVAEESGLIGPLGEFVLGEATRQLRQWHDQFPQLSHLDLAVNLSARQLTQDGLADVVAGILGASGLDPSYLIVEITESIFMSDARASINAVSALAALGVRVAIDDFGTGYSSLAYLKKFSADVLKIDKSFIDGLGTDTQDNAIVGATIALADALGMQTVAEGVEHQVQLDQLRLMGCDRYQGYHFARPGNALEIGDLLGRVASRSAVPSGSKELSAVNHADDLTPSCLVVGAGADTT